MPFISTNSQSKHKEKTLLKVLMSVQFENPFKYCLSGSNICGGFFYENMGNF